MKFFPSLLVSLSLFSVLACEREKEEKPEFPSLEYHSPNVVSGGESYTFYGSKLNGSQVYANGELIQNTSSNNSGNEIYCVLPPEYMGQDLMVVLPDGKEHEIIIDQSADTEAGVEALLFTDFDGLGIRPAKSDFPSSQWSSEVLPFGTNGISKNAAGFGSSPAGGAYAFFKVAKANRNNENWDGSIVSRTELQNDGVTPWPLNISEYPLIPFTFDGNPNDYYVNFYFHSGGQAGNTISVLLQNLRVPKAEQYQYRFTMTASNQWQKISLPLSLFRDGYGFGTALGKPQMDQFNGIQFELLRDPNYSGTLEDAVLAVDQISISKGKMYL